MKIVRRLWAPFVALVFFAVLAVVNRDLLLFELEEAADRTTVVLAYALQIAIWLSVALFIDRIITVLVWEGLVPKTIGTAPPKLLVQLSSVVVYLIAFTGIVGIVFDQPVTGIWATSGILGLVLGLDFFSGIALNVESPFKVGDWIVVHNRDLGGTGQHIGCVREIVSFRQACVTWLSCDR